MVTPKLEELILCGLAEYRTYGCAGSSNYKMNIPDNAFIIITDIIWNNFLQAVDPDPTLEDFAAFNAYQLRFSDSNKKYNHIHIRNSVDIIPSQNWVFNPQVDKASTMRARTMIIPKPPQQFHVFFVHRRLLELNLILHEKPKNLQYQFGTIVDAPGLLSSPPIDTGGVGGLNTVTFIRNPATGSDVLENYPQGFDFTPAPPPGSVSNPEFIELNHQRYQLKAPTALALPDIGSPLFTIGYVIVRDEKNFTALQERGKK